jgi:hypothetical protein
MGPIQHHEIGVLEHAGVRLPRPASAVAVWRLVRGPLKVRRMAALASTAHGLSSAVKSVLKLRALQSLVIAVDYAVQAGRDGRMFTANGYVEALAERWSESYRRTRDTHGTGRLADFKPETVRAIREELIGSGVPLAKLWRAIRGGVPDLYALGAPIRNKGRRVSLEDDDGVAPPLLAKLDTILDADTRYRRDRVRGPRLLLAADPMPPRKIAQRVAGERPFDIMHIGPTTEHTLKFLESARAWLHVPELLADIDRVEAACASSRWSAIKRSWNAALPVVVAQAGLDVPRKAPKRAPADVRFWNEVERRLFWKARKAFIGRTWREYLAHGNHQSERARYNSLKGRLASMTAIRDQLRERGVLDHEYVELKSSFYKHRTRRFQTVNVWPSEASSGDATVEPLTPEMQEAMVRARAPLPPAITSAFPSLRDSTRMQYDHGVALPTVFAVPQRVRWFKAPAWFNPEFDKESEWDPSEHEWFAGHDISGSQAQILAVFMGLHDIEKQLRETPFKKLVARSARVLHEEGKLRLPDEMLENAGLLEETGKLAMPLLYGATDRNLALKMQRDPEKYGPGLDAAALAVLFRGTPIIEKLRLFLAVCEEVGAAAYAKNPAAGVTVTDPLDGATFTWNPPKRRKVQMPSGAFKIYCYPPVLVAGESQVDKVKLTRRIAPGLIQTLDALFAAGVMLTLNYIATQVRANVPTLVAVHDAFLVPESASHLLPAAIEGAGQLWLPKLGPVYEVLERYLPSDHAYGQLVREWRAKWEQRMRDCDWPNFRTKPEGAEYR